ncbi:S-adenosyl-L-methionine-dependent methyltransferase [Quillaja saponaria]|uniref:S-adenosyl-L-methionine-dependent methyltransferase n=1 Tax=Quillaja saponaria TaxID=32244 RepID=A0AAD7VEY6_QUISA|nr:S-adenosyl-L-methionine-dependent methyltransferase [Quillaja saponaria]
MGKSCFPRCRLARIMGWLQILLGGLVIIVSISSLFKFYSAGFLLHNEDICRHFYSVKDVYVGFDVKALSDRVREVLDKLESLQEKLESKVQQMEKNKDVLDRSHITGIEYKKYLEDEVIRPLYSAHIALRQIRLPKLEGIGNSTMKEDPLINTFVVEEIRKYITPKDNRISKINIYGTEGIHNTIGHACVLYKKELEQYMDYDIGSYCDDDWNLAQKLMLNGCDPLPRRRCLTRASKVYQKPYPSNESLWRLPDGRNVRWSNYQCRNFECLSSKHPKRGYSKCTGCFEMEKEKLKWVTNSSLPVDFLISDVLAIKPAVIRIGLDFGIGTGTFAARMREQNVTIISTALNLGAPFNEMIALRGLIPLYVTLNQRLPFFDNTMDLIHSTGFMDGWIDLQLMDFILYDWDRILRPGGLLWIDRFFCNRKDLDDYMYMFLQFRYKKHKWVLSPKSKDEVYLSALLEKPPRAI